MQELGVKVKHALSPQAKGRVERANGTLQKHLVWEMRITGMSSIGEVNSFVREYYIDKHNNMFAKEAAQPGDVHRPEDQRMLENMLCFKSTPILANDYVIFYQKAFIPT